MKKINENLALWITNHVGTMECAYLFALIGGAGVYYALTGNTKGVLIIGSISGYFFQLVLLPIIMVGQNIQSAKHDQLHVKVDAIHEHFNIGKKET
jgi:polysaccharide pyruvyl transferase WcaK-like protein